MSLGGKKRTVASIEGKGESSENTSSSWRSSNKDRTMIPVTTRPPRAAKERKKTTNTNSTISQTKLVNNINSTTKHPIEGETNSSKTATRLKRHAWSSIGTGLFFEGLYEHGKSFERILAFMQHKYKKKTPDSFIINLGKNQVRFFYYRTWHKVSSLLTKAQRDIERESQSPSKRNTKTTKKTNMVTATTTTISQSEDEETEEGEMMEGDIPFDTSLDEGEEQFPNVQTSIEDEQFVIPTSDLSTPADPSLLPPDSSPYNPSSVEAEQEYGDKDAPPIAPPILSPPSEAPPISNEGGEKGIMSKSDKKKESLIIANGGWYPLDLVAMICFRKLKQKFRGDSATFGKKLYELVYRGSTTIRIKGRRNIQIKIPNCPALRPFKIPTDNTNRIEDTDSIDVQQLNSSLPITLELRPLNASTWEYIQQISINPRLRLTTPPSRTMGELFDFIATKWHLSSKDIFDTLKLYKTDDLSLVMTGEQSSLSTVSSFSGMPLLLTPYMTVKDLKVMVTSGIHNQLICLQYDINFPSTELTDTPLHSLLNFIQSSDIMESPAQTPSFHSSSPPLPPPLLMSSNTNYTPSFTVTPSVNTVSNVVDTPRNTTVPCLADTPSVPNVCTPNVPSVNTPNVPSVNTPRNTVPNVTGNLSVVDTLRNPNVSDSPTVLSVIDTLKNITPVTHVNSMTPQTPLKIPPLIPDVSSLERRTSTSVPSKTAAAIISSPKVRQYWQELSRKSPMKNIMKSPLSKYRKLQMNSNKVSPLRSISSVPSSNKGTSRMRQVKRTRLQFPDNPLPPPLPPPLASPLSCSKQLFTETATATSKQQQQQTNIPLKVSTAKGFGTFIDLSTDSNKCKDVEFSLAKLNSGKSKQSLRNKGEKYHHLVTVPKQSFSTGSFSTFRLTDLFQTVQDNLKTITPPCTTESGSTSSKGILTDYAPPDTLKDAIEATASNKKSSTQQQSITDPSPLQVYASQVARTKGGGTKKPSNISVKTLSPTVSSSVTTSNTVTISSTGETTITPKAGTTTPTGGTFTRIGGTTTVTTPPTHHIELKKFTRKRNISNSMPRQRPVVLPKPLQYFSHLSPPSTSITLSSSARPLQFNNSTPVISTTFNTVSSNLLTTTNTDTVPVTAVYSNKPVAPPSITTNTGPPRTNTLLQYDHKPASLHSLAPNIATNTLQYGGKPSLLPSVHSSSNNSIGTSSIIGGATSQTQYLQQQVTSLLLNMLLQQQSKLTPHQRQEVQSVINSLTTPTVTISTAPPLPPPSLSLVLPLPTTTTTNTVPVKQSEIKSTPSYNIPPLVSTSPPLLSPPLDHHTSDTVNELLRGLTSNTDNEQASLQKLSEETVDVLPTFAHAMMQMSSNPVGSGGERSDVSSSYELPTEIIPSGGFSDNSLFQLLQCTTDEQQYAGTAATLSDSNLKQIIDNTEFNEMFSQLRDILKTPDKNIKRSSNSTTTNSSREESRGEGSSNKTISPQQPATEQDSASNGELLDPFSSPFKLKSSDYQMPTGRSLLEENSVDYINKFKELASAMSRSQAQN